MALGISLPCPSRCPGRLHPVGDGSRVRFCVHPHQPGVAPEPAFLANRQLLGALHGSRDGVRQGALTVEVLGQLSVSERLGGGPREAARQLHQGPHLIEQAGVDHCVEALGDATGGHRPLQTKPNLHERRRRVGIQSRPKRRERAAGAQRDLQRSQHSAPVGWLHSLGRHRVEAGQAPVHRPEAVLIDRLGLQRGKHLRKSAGKGQIVDHRLVVQPGSTDEQPMCAAADDVVEGLVGSALEAGHRELLVGLDRVDEVVGHSSALGERRRRRADVEVPVHGHRVGGHRLQRAHQLGERQRDRRLAGGGWPDQRARPIQPFRTRPTGTTRPGTRSASRRRRARR